MTELELRADVVKTAQSWLGKNEADGSFQVILDLYNAHRPLPRNYRLTKQDPWCAGTLSALAIANGLTRILPVECSCSRMIAQLRALDAWVERDSYHPSAGDLLFYDWDDSSADSSQDNRGAPEHVGVVEQVNNGHITVIEGNKDRAVARRVLPINGRFIRGYGTPNYALEAAFRSIDELSRIQVLNTPAYWRQILLFDQVPHLGLLLCKASSVIHTASPRTDTAEEGLEALVQAGIIDSPDYWRKAAQSHPVVGELLKALGGAALAV